MKNTKRTRSLWLMVAPIILLLAAPHQVNAQKAPPDDTKFLNLLVGTVQSRVMSTSGTRFEVNATGIEVSGIPADQLKVQNERGQRSQSRL